jgi:hypothetical protein
MDEDGYRWRSLSVRGGDPGFTRIDAPRVGISFLYEVSEESRLENRILAEGGGVALGDVDRDGLPDLFFAGVSGRSALYRNLGGWRFEDVTQRAGLALAGLAARGAAFTDADGDGDLDLVVTVHGARNRLYVNDGSGLFVERSDAGFVTEAGSTTPALADVDGDGDLDLYVANYKTRQADDLFSPAQRSFDRIRPDETGVVRLPAELEGHYRIEVEGTVTRRWELGEPDEFYLNDGSGRFGRVDFNGGRFLDETGQPLPVSPRDWGLSARFHDWDLDGDADLYVANDFSSPDHVWVNEGEGVFRAAPAIAIRTTSLSSMTVFSDLDLDGDVDLLTTDMLARDRTRRLMQVPSVMPDPVAPGEIDPRPQVNRNTLQLNRGDATFAEAAWTAGIAASDWTWGALFLDVDLDGYEDLLVTTGHVWDQLDADTHARLRAAPGAVDWRRELSAFPGLRQPNAAFRNRGDATFEDVSEDWGFGADADISHGIASADLDGDGDRDVVVTRFGDPPALYRNESNAERVAVRLAGEPPNTGAVGARVHLIGHPAGEQQKQVTAGGFYLSSSDGSVTFAADGAGDLELIVEWPGGRQTRIADIRPNRLYEIPQGEASPEAGGPATATGLGPEAEPGTARDVQLTHFVDESASLGHANVDTPFDDALLQPLLPNRLSQLGPGVTWLDTDGDGDPDLIIAGGRGGRLAFYRNDAGTLEPMDLGWGDAAWDQTTVLGLPADPDGPVPVDAATGLRQDLLVGQMSYEASSPAEAVDIPSVVRMSLGGGRGPSGSVQPVVPGDRSTAGALAQADIDGDGDLDLFVGGRVIPAAYPIAASSRLLRNEGDRFLADSALSAPFVDVGLVSAAVFSDVDLDGDPDLVLAIEWGPVRVFRNEDGAFTDATEPLGLDEAVGRWNGITTGDLNADGYPDLVATGWGRNTEYAEHGDRYTLVYGDLDRNGILDLVEALPSAGELRPLARLDQLGRGIPFLQRRPGGHEAFAAASLEDLFGEALPRAGQLEVLTLQHTLFLNRQTHFEAVPLPFAAQLAPASHVGVADLDGDGAEDVFITQNFFPLRRGIPRYDAGRSLWLRGDGRGGLTPVPGHVSGIAVYGDARGAAFADYDRDGRVDIVVAQNGSVTKLYRNVGAAPGLRVRLLGPPGNPQAIGASLRLVYEDGFGPSREVRSGGGYWSRDEAVQTLGLSGRPTGIRVRWPNGRVSEARLEEEVREVRLRIPERRSASRTRGKKRGPA